MSHPARFSFLFAVTCLCAACSGKGASAGDGPASQVASGSASASNATFANRGGDACVKYLTPGIIQKVVGGPTRPAKKLSAQSCTIERTDDAGSITITLDASDAASFKAYQKYLTNPEPLAGVGDEAVQTLLGIVSIKAPSMGCDIDAGGAPGSVKENHAALGKDLGDICNRIFADGP